MLKCCPALAKSPRINMRRNMHPLSIGKNVLKGMVDDLILQMRPRSLQTVTISINTSLLQGTGLKMPEGAIQ